MEQINIGTSALKTSRIGLGTWAIGGWQWGGTDEAASIATIRAAVERGVTLIDTAPVYGFGRSEEIVGKALAEGGLRDRVQIATKVGLAWKDGVIYRDSRPARLRREIEDSLRRLRTDVIDLYQVHWPDLETPFAETARTLEDLHREGKIRAIGVSNFSPAQMDAFRAVAELAAVQPPYNLFEREIEADVLPYARRTALTVLSYGALCRGLLPSSRNVVGGFEFRASAVIVTSGGIGGNHDLVRQNWPQRMGRVPEQLLSGVPAHVDGRMIGIAEKAGARLINRDRMWHYTEGITNYNPVWPRHGIRIIPGPSSLWLDAKGQRLPAPLYPGFDTLGTLEYIAQSGYDYTWFVLNAKIIEKEFALSGQEQNPDLTGRSVRQLLSSRARSGPPAPVQAFVDRGVDFVSAHSLRDLVSAMNKLPDVLPLDYATVVAEVTARDREVANRFSKDSQITAIHAARRYLGDRLGRVVAPHRLTDPKAGPMIAVKLHILTRKTLGGLETDLESRVLQGDGTPLDGLYAAGEVAGFGGGGVHGYRALEGTFLGGCIFSGRAAGRGAAADIA